MSTPFDIADAVDALATGNYSVSRPTPGGYDTNGRVIAPTFAALTVRASITPARGRDILRLPEGNRSTEAIAILATSEVKVDDRITYNGRVYVVGHSAPWFGGFWEAVATAA